MLNYQDTYKYKTDTKGGPVVNHLHSEHDLVKLGFGPKLCSSFFIFREKNSQLSKLELPIFFSENQQKSSKVC